jgi:hypothetical protein
MRWKNCTFNTGNAGNHVYNGGGIGGVYNDLSTSTITGTIGKATYWDASDSTNKLPTVLP